MHLMFQNAVLLLCSVLVSMFLVGTNKNVHVPDVCLF